MVKYDGTNRRRHDRYDTDLEIQFYVSFDVETKIDFRIKTKKEYSQQKYKATSRNVSVEGICFMSEKKVSKGNGILLELYLPSAKEPIRMEGVVKWCRLLEVDEKEMYDTGVHLSFVNNENVENSIFIDEIHGVVWSNVLESVFGNFKHFALKRKKEQKKNNPADS